jgi:hypothetical protein
MPPPPPPPTNVAGWNATGSSVNVTWDPIPSEPSSGYGYTSVSYLVTAIPGGFSATTTGSQVAITGLAAGTAYFFVVTAVADGQSSPASQRSPYPCYPGTRPPSTPTILAITGHSGLLTVQWAAPSVGDVVNYILSVEGPGLPGGQFFTNQILGSELSFTLGGAVDGQVYSVSLQAFSCSGISQIAATSSRVATTVPGAPAHVSVNLVGDSEVARVTWALPVGSTSTDQLLYNVWPLYDQSAGGALPAMTNVPCCTITFSGLALGVTYTFMVNATNSAGTGPSTQSPPAVPGIGFPDAPTGLTAVSPSANMLVVSWTPLRDDQSGGSPVIGYVCNLFVADATDSVLSANVSAANSTMWIWGVHVATLYNYTLTAYSARGPGAVAVSASPVMSLPDPPSAPLNVFASMIPGDACPFNQSGVQVQWSLPAYTGGLDVPTSPMWYDVFETDSSLPLSTQVRVWGPSRR